MAELNQIEAATKRYVGASSAQLIDNVFNPDPFLAYLKGKTFNITQPQVEQQLQFQPKFHEVDVTLFKEDIQVINAGGAQLFSLIKSRMENAYATIGADLSIPLFLPGEE